MSAENQQNYKNLLEELRHRYRLRYGTILDDEILYLIIRMNELQVDLKNEVKLINKVSFVTGSSYLMYGLGKSIGYLLFGVGLLGVLGIYYVSSTPTCEDQYQYIETPKGFVLYLKSFRGKDTIIEVHSTKGK